jgi:hypothetical protein
VWEAAGGAGALLGRSLASLMCWGCSLTRWLVRVGPLNFHSPSHTHSHEINKRFLNFYLQTPVASFQLPPTKCVSFLYLFPRTHFISNYRTL